MKKHENSALQTFRRSRAWIDTKPGYVNVTPGMPDLLTRLDSVIAGLSTAGADQERLRVGSMERSASADRVRMELRQNHLLPIITVARAAASTTPDILADVRLPETRNTERVLASASAIATAIEPLQQQFIDNGLPENFYERLVEKTTALRQLIDRRGVTRVHRTKATEHAASVVTEGKNVLRLIGSALRSTLVSSEDLSEWLAASHIDATRVRSRNTGSAETQEQVQQPSAEQHATTAVGDTAFGKAA